MGRKICKHVDLSYEKPSKTIGSFTGMKFPDTKENIKHSEKRTSLSFSPERHLAWGSLSFGGQTCGRHKLMVAWISCSVVVVGAGRRHPLFPSHTHPMLQCDGIPKWALCGVSKWDGYRITGYVLLWRRMTDNVGIGPSVREDSWLDRWCNRNRCWKKTSKPTRHSYSLPAEAYASPGRMNDSCDPDDQVVPTSYRGFI